MSTPSPAKSISSSDTSIEPSWAQPSHPDLINVVKSDLSFASYATSLVSLPAGAHFASITNHHYVSSRSYITVEAPDGQHIDLNSDLFYTNHSCDPALEFDVTKMEIRVSQHRALSEGDVLTFFYPSTEYHIAQPFHCHCKAKQCKGRILGAGDMGLGQLDGYWLNRHVEDQLNVKERGI